MCMCVVVVTMMMIMLTNSNTFIIVVVIIIGNIANFDITGLVVTCGRGSSGDGSRGSRSSGKVVTITVATAFGKAFTIDVSDNR